MSEKHFLTKKGIQKLEKELEELTSVTRHEIAEKIRQAVSFGDLSENSEYHEAKEAQAFIEGRIQEIQEVLANYELIREKREGTRVTIGCLVKLQAKGSSAAEEFIIVGSEEAVPSERKISHESPLGRGLLGSKKGDEVEIETPSGVIHFKVVDVK